MPTKSRSLALLTLATLAPVLSAGCGGDDGSGTGSSTCGRLSGSWTISGNCPETSTCTLTQNGCSFSMTCADGTSVSGSSSATGVSFANADVRCSGQLAARAGITTTIGGSCTFMGGSCTYTATCNGGDCTEPFASASGTGGAGNAGAGGTLGGGGGGAGRDAGAGGVTGGGGGPVRDAGAGCAPTSYVCGTDGNGVETACGSGLICCYTAGPNGSSTCGASSRCVAPGTEVGPSDGCAAGQVRLCKTDAECGTGFRCSGPANGYCL